MPVFQCEACDPLYPCMFINTSPFAGVPPDCPYNEGVIPACHYLHGSDHRCLLKRLEGPKTRCPERRRCNVCGLLTKEEYL